MASINACSIVAPTRCCQLPRPLRSVPPPARPAQSGEPLRCRSHCLWAKPRCHAPVLRNPIADQIGGQALAGYTFGHQALVNVIKIELQRTNERIPGSHTLSFIRFREVLHGISQAARGRCAGTLLVCNAFECVHALLQRCYVLGVAWRGASRAVQLRLKRLFCIFNRFKFFPDRRGRSCRSSKSPRPPATREAWLQPPPSAPVRPAPVRFSMAVPCLI